MASGNFFDFHEKVKGRRPAARAHPTPPPPADPVPAAAAAPEPLTVSQVTRMVDDAVRGGLPESLLVKGELSNYRPNPSSGHVYLTLKDHKTCLDCVMFRDEAATLKFTPQDGMEVLAGGQVRVYGARGRYQLYVKTLQPLGQGALELAMRQLLAKLHAEGLFEAERKKPLPRYPRRIVLLTSSSTAALQDMLKVLRRFPWLHLFLYHVPVQGDGCGRQIADAVRHLNRYAKAAGGFDLILMGRGGGSLEDLWGFNDEAVARAIAASRVPVVTGIGHEIDTSIADLVADYHAHTPTEAAQVVTAHWRAAGDTLDYAAARLRRGLRETVQAARGRLAAVERHEAFRRPTEHVEDLRQLLDDRQRAMLVAMTESLFDAQRRLAAVDQRLGQFEPTRLMVRLYERVAAAETRLVAATRQKLSRELGRLAELDARLSGRHPRHRRDLESERLAALAARLERSMHDCLARRFQRLAAMSKFLAAIGPEQVLRRGYSLTLRKKDGAVVRNPSQVKPGERVVTLLAEGRIESTVDDAAQLRLFE